LKNTRMHACTRTRSHILHTCRTALIHASFRGLLLHKQHEIKPTQMGVRAHYCSRDCQVAAWKGGHKRECVPAAAGGGGGGGRKKKGGK